MKTFTKLAIATAFGLIFGGCGTIGNSNSTNSPTSTQSIKGKLVDAPVEGVKYICGDIEGFTDENGLFKCKNFPIKFMVGEVELGEIKSLPKDGIVTPQDLAGVNRDDLNDSKVCNIAIFLQSLDNDGLFDDVITIDDEVIVNLNKKLEIKHIKEEKLRALLEDAGVEFIISKKRALEHLKKSMEKIKKGANSFSFTGDSGDFNYLDSNKTHSKESNKSKKPTKNSFNHNKNKDSNSSNNKASKHKSQSQNSNSSKNSSSHQKRFLVDIAEGVVFDRDTKKIWQNSKIGHGTRQDAIKFCQELNLGGLKWRLPSSSESKTFHYIMNQQGDTPQQAFSKCVAEVTEDGYIKTKKGAKTYGGEPGDEINFSGAANIRCISDGEKRAPTNKTSKTDNKVSIDDSLKKEFLKAINDARAMGRRCGDYGYFKAVPPLKWSDKLYLAAYRHSYDMAKVNYFSHTGSGKKTDLAAQAYHPGTGSSMKERINYAEYKNWRKIGENIAAGTNMDTAKKAVEAWINSPGHCKNLMSPDFTEVGLAVVYDSNSHYKYYWTQDFGTRK